MRVRHLAGAVAAASLAAAPLAAQQSVISAEVTPYAGYMFFGDYVKGPLGTSLGNASGAVLGAQLGLRVTPQIALVGNVARASGDLQIGLPVIGGIGVGSTEMWLFDAGLQLGVPAIGRGGLGLAPFVQAGVGGARHNVSNPIVNANATNLAYNVGAGADVMLAPNVGLRIMAKDYIGRFDVQEATSVGLVEGRWSHNVALSAGLKLAF